MASAQPASILARPIPSSGEALPAVGLGTWQQFDVGPKAKELADLGEVLRVLFAGGGSVIDSSPMYGQAEARVGDLLGRMDARESALVATKVWTSGREAGIRQMETSMRLMRAEPIDLMQVHNLVDVDTHLATLRAWKDAGRVRYVGVTHYTTGALEELARVIARHRPDFVQLAYSIGVREAQDRVLPLARDLGVAVIVNRPFEGGGGFARVRGRELPAWAREFCDSWGRFLLKFILAREAVTCVIPGTSRPRHMADNLGAGMGRLPDAGEIRRMAEFWDGL